MRRPKRLAIVLASTAVLALGGSIPAYAGAGADRAWPHHGNPNVVRASLSGDKEVPGPGDEDGHGHAKVVLRSDRICYWLSWRDIEAPTAAHIHVGSRTEAGPVVLGLLSVPAPGLQPPVSSVGGCAAADSALINAIRTSPRDYYVNVHNVDYPGGAIRGQLH